jgi:hypothetical protein
MSGVGCGLRSAFGVAPMRAEPSRCGVLSIYRATPCMTRKKHCDGGRFTTPPRLRREASKRRGNRPSSEVASWVGRHFPVEFVNGRLKNVLLSKFL